MSATEAAPHVTVVLPCHNEESHVADEIKRIRAALDAAKHDYEIIAVDDASTDSTARLLREAAETDPRVHVMAFEHNGGVGTARRIATYKARGEVVVWTDADMTYPNDRIPEFVDLLDDDPWTDQVVGRRLQESGSLRPLRVPAKWLVRKLAEFLTNTRIPDLNSGMRAFRRDVAWPYLHLLPPGFSCVTTLTLAFLSNQHRIRYLPIDYAKRSGRSKFRLLSDAYRYILQVLRMVMYFNPLKVLMPVALTLLVVGFGKGVYDVVSIPVYVRNNTIMLVLSGLVIGSIGLLADLIVRSRGAMR
jgi:glycosyltransferase involved in cell wall biosynthesis